MDDLKDQSAVSTTATNGVVESEEVRAQEALLGDTDPSLTSADDVAKALNVDPSHGLSEEEAKRRLAKFGPNELASAPPASRNALTAAKACPTTSRTIRSSTPVPPRRRKATPAAPWARRPPTAWARTLIRSRLPAGPWS